MRNVPHVACLVTAAFAFAFSGLPFLPRVSAEEAKPPTLSSFVPAGGQEGTTVDVTASGEFPTWPLEVWTDRGGLVWKPLEEAGHFEVTIPPAGSLGLHRVRLHDSNGATVVKPFLVGNVVESAETEPNNILAEATPLEALPQTVNGRLEKSGDVDSFRVHLQAGETLVAALEANRLLGSPVDAVVELVDEGGAYLARNLDATGLDPRLAYTAKRDGIHIVRVYGFPSAPNSTIGLAGGADYLYRLTLTTGGFVSGCLPSVATENVATALTPVGWNLPGTPPPLAIAPVGDRMTWVAFPDMAGIAEVPVVAGTRVTIAGPHATAEGSLTPPFIASGVFTHPDEEHRYVVDASKDQKLLVRIESQKAGFEADPLLVIRDAEGASLQAKPERDAAITWSAPADGRYHFDVRDRRGRSGPGHLYRLTVEPEQPTFAATVAADAFTAKVGEPLTIEIAIDRKHGFAEAVEFALDLAPEGVTAEPVISPSEGDTAKKVTLTLTATSPASGVVRLIARPTTEDAGPSAATPTPVTFGSDALLEAWLTILPAPQATDAAPPATE